MHQLIPESISIQASMESCNPKVTDVAVKSKHYSPFADRVAGAFLPPHRCANIREGLAGEGPLALQALQAAREAPLLALHLPRLHAHLKVRLALRMQVKRLAVIAVEQAVP
eukprot:366351-Chlamydomonas_euryale.AAC.8